MDGSTWDGTECRRRISRAVDRTIRLTGLGERDIMFWLKQSGRSDDECGQILAEKALMDTMRIPRSPISPYPPIEGMS